MTNMNVMIVVYNNIPLQMSLIKDSIVVNDVAYRIIFLIFSIFVMFFNVKEYTARKYDVLAINTQNNVLQKREENDKK